MAIRWQPSFRKWKGLDATRPQPTRLPNTVAAGLKRNRYARDRVPTLCRLLAPPVQQQEQRVCVGAKLLQWPGYDSSDEPAREAHLDDRELLALDHDVR